MKRKLHLKGRQKNRLKTALVVGGVSIGVMCMLGWFVFINVTNNIETKAISNGWSLNNGEIISNFTWENGEPTKAATGPDAIKISPKAYVAFGGKNSKGALAPGTPSNDINMELESTPLFNTEGIDISIDYRGTEASGSFFSRGKGFNFGFENNYLSITYRIQSGKGYETISETTNYELINDGLYRNYRFIYTPTTGKGEIFVNNVIVWSYQSQRNTMLWWSTTDNITIAKGIDGGGNDTPVLDNLTIRSTGTTSPLAESLIGFTLKTMTGVVTINWTTTANDKADFFTIQRSVNGTDFTTLTTLKANPAQKENEEYTFTDKNFTAAGIYYYRIKQTFKDGRFITHNISATKVTVPSTLSIERITPTMFKTSFSVAYTIPETGKVELQLIDGSGSVKTTEVVEAQKGKNIFQFNDIQKLPEGEYTLYVVYNETKLSATVTKNLSGIF